jgi:SAM-dependent methyltransferase
MSDWIRRLFIDRSSLFLKFLDQRWGHTENLVDGMIRVLRDGGIASGRLLDLFCGNGRVSIRMAEKGFTTVGVDISKGFIADARKKAVAHQVSDAVTFHVGDARNLRQLLGSRTPPFDVVVNTWTSVGYYSPAEDLAIFRQARELSREGAILIVAQTLHSARAHLSLNFAPDLFMEAEGLVVLETRKYDPIKSHLSTSWAFYERQGDDLRYIDTTQLELHVYSLSELCALLSEAGWDPVATYGNLKTQQPPSPLSSLNIVAKARQREANL